MKRTLQLFLVALMVSMGISYGQENALDFDSTNYVTIPAISDVQGTAARTVEMWIKAEPDQESQAQFIQWGTFESGTKFSIRMDKDANFALRVEHGGGAHVGTTSLNDGEWKHIAVTLPADGLMNQSKLYVDGQLETSSNSPNDVAFNTGDSEIQLCRTAYDGGNPNPNPYRTYRGLIDELRIWKKELTVDEILAVKDSVICPENYSDLVAYFRFNEGTDTIVADETGNFEGYFGAGDGNTEEYPTWAEGMTELETSDCEGSTSIINYDDLTEIINMYPNPSKNQIKLDFEKQIEKAVVYNIVGKEVLSVKKPEQNIINVSSLKPGIYMLRLYAVQNKEIGTLKLIRE